ncbi:DUF1659 domain-containing protein [Niallia oryzisoli]|uniref:DUF1659 domain-containing protein n=1 Tax=Niallia oryzisoli TaxID=1737571 RepID=A0ABZ2CIW2_9BACI
MAQTLIKSMKLRLTFEKGIDEGGKSIFKTKTYSGVVESATADQLYQIGQSLASLSIHPLATVEKNGMYEVMA